MSRPEDKDTPTGLIRIVRQESDQRSEEIKTKVRRISEKMRAVRSRVTSTQYQYINRRRRANSR